ncbi:thioesterase family protein [Xylariales sp. PMI_506]|nr:thioesterase family protein [Xylariales sp. PMI_506]
MASILKDQINLKQIASHSYTVSYHADWTVGLVLHGGSIAAAIYHAATTHLSTTLAAQDQPDILTLHFEFLRPCELCESTISVVDLKVGTVTSTIQLQLSQKGKARVMALATATNFDKLVGPTVPTAWEFYPAPRPKPDFAKVLAHQPDNHWLPFYISGEILPFTRRLLVLNPRDGLPVDGICDAWTSAMNSDPMDATYLTQMTDTIPSMSDTLLRNGGIYDAHRQYADLARWAEKNPGSPAKLTNSLKDGMRATIFNNTVTLDIEFKRRLPKEGVQWIFIRTATRSLENGRLDIDVTICNEKMELLCLSRQVILALDAKRKFGGGRGKPTL